MTGPSMKGVTGWSFHKQRAAVAWKATNQTIVSLFSTEAELIAVDEATRNYDSCTTCFSTSTSMLTCPQE